MLESVMSFENLYRAHRRARLGKRHKKEVILFEANLSQNLWALYYDLKYEKYEVGEYHKFMIYDPKEREIQAISYRDRIVQHCLCDNYLMPLLDRRLIYDNAACRKGKGTTFAIARWRDFMAKHYQKHGEKGWFVKLDITKYFPSIDHAILKLKLMKIVRDGKMLRLLYRIIDSYNGQEGRGLPMGNQTSQCFALLYLDRIDRVIKERLGINKYVRYMDDMLLLTETKEKARLCLETVYAEVRKEKMILNAKSQIIALRNGVEFLGWRFLYGTNGKIVQKLRHSTKKRIFSHAKEIARIGSEEKKRQAQDSYAGYLVRGNTYRIARRVARTLSLTEKQETSVDILHV